MKLQIYHHVYVRGSRKQSAWDRVMALILIKFVLPSLEHLISGFKE